jgi:aquaporin related protein
MNPARSFAPAIWHRSFVAHWIYWAGPILAAIVTTYLYKYVFWKEAPETIKQRDGKLDEMETLNQGRNNA